MLTVVLILTIANLLFLALNQYRLKHGLIDTNKNLLAIYNRIKRS